MDTPNPIWFFAGFKDTPMPEFLVYATVYWFLVATVGSSTPEEIHYRIDLNT